MYKLMELVIEMSQKAFVSEEAREGLRSHGQTNLMNIHDPEYEQALEVHLDAFNQKQDILHLLDQATNAAGVQLFAGEESAINLLMIGIRSNSQLIQASIRFYKRFRCYWSNRMEYERLYQL